MDGFEESKRDKAALTSDVARFEGASLIRKFYLSMHASMSFALRLGCYTGVDLLFELSLLTRLAGISMRDFLTD